MIERVVYDTEHDRWYKAGDDPWTVRDVPKNRVVQPIPSATADTYTDAFFALFGHNVFIPTQLRAPKRAVFA